MNKAAFGKRLKQARNDRHLTSDKLAELCDLNAVFIRQIEGGTRLPSISNLVEICKALKITPNFLLGADLVFDDDEVERFIQQIRTLSPKQFEMVYSTVGTLLSHM